MFLQNHQLWVNVWYCDFFACFSTLLRLILLTTHCYEQGTLSCAMTLHNVVITSFWNGLSYSDALWMQTLPLWHWNQLMLHDLMNNKWFHGNWDLVFEVSPWPIEGKRGRGCTCYSSNNSNNTVELKTLICCTERQVQTSIQIRQSTNRRPLTLSWCEFTMQYGVSTPWSNWLFHGGV